MVLPIPTSLKVLCKQPYGHTPKSHLESHFFGDSKAHQVDNQDLLLHFVTKFRLKHTRLFKVLYEDRQQ